MSRKIRARRIVLVPDDDPQYGKDSAMGDTPILYGSVLFMREGLYDAVKFAHIPEVDRGMLECRRSHAKEDIQQEASGR